MATHPLALGRSRNRLPNPSPHSINGLGRLPGHFVHIEPTYEMRLAQFRKIKEMMSACAEGEVREGCSTPPKVPEGSSTPPKVPDGGGCSTPPEVSEGGCSTPPEVPEGGCSTPPEVPVSSISELQQSSTPTNVTPLIVDLTDGEESPIVTKSSGNFYFCTSIFSMRENQFV